MIPLRAPEPRLLFPVEALYPGAVSTTPFWGLSRATNYGNACALPPFSDWIHAYPLTRFFAAYDRLRFRDAPPPDDGTFRAEGTLEFVRADGSVIRAIEIEFAEDEEARRRGLMHRRQMTLNQGMLFLFPAPDNLSFWMANTPIPLDIMFVAADSQIVNIARRTRPLSRENVTSNGLAQYVVEVRGGFSDRFGIDESVKVRWQRNR